jgi:hypothetical protein
MGQVKKYSKCFPLADHIKALEILYGDFISDEELVGGVSPD